MIELEEVNKYLQKSQRVELSNYLTDIKGNEFEGNETLQELSLVNMTFNLMSIGDGLKFKLLG